MNPSLIGISCFKMEDHSPLKCLIKPFVTWRLFHSAQQFARVNVLSLAKYINLSMQVCQ
jgi:hypothetical protein